MDARLDRSDTLRRWKSALSTDSEREVLRKSIEFADQDGAHGLIRLE